MIIAGILGIYETPEDIEDISSPEGFKLQNAFEEHKIAFVIPDPLFEKAQKTKNANVFLEAYKIGLLKIFLEKIYPEKKYSDYFHMINKEFQVFSSKRTMQLRYTFFKKNEEFFFNVSS